MKKLTSKRLPFRADGTPDFYGAGCHAAERDYMPALCRLITDAWLRHHNFAQMQRLYKQSDPEYDMVCHDDFLRGVSDRLEKLLLLKVEVTGPDVDMYLHILVRRPRRWRAMLGWFRP